MHSAAVPAWYIYALRDPLTWDVRYIGKTRRSPAIRLHRHIAEAHLHNYRSARWVQWLTARGARPLLEVLETGSGDGDGVAERAWIAEYKRRGADLTNITAGGDGGSGPCTPEARAKISARHRGVPHSAAHTEAAAAGKRGQKRPQAAIEAQRAAIMGHEVSAVTRAKIAAAITGRKISQATIDKMKVAQAARGKRERLAREADPSAFRRPPKTAETLAKMTIAQRARRERQKRERFAAQPLAPPVSESPAPSPP